jgi:GTP-dependent dephospho-CoA kinase
MAMLTYSIPPEIRDALKKPMGRLLKDGEVNNEMLSHLFSESLTVSVGDRTTERLLEMGFAPNLEIVDGVERRVKRESPEWKGDPENLLKAENPAGSISSDSLQKLSDCLSVLKASKSKAMRLEIAGEEDLLVLPVLAFFPQNTTVLYGQPLEGLVVVSGETARKNSRTYLHKIGIDALPETSKVTTSDDARGTKG